MESEVLACGYSYHTKPFTTTTTNTTTFINGLPTFLFRLQTEGSCHVLINGKMRKISTGDLLLLRPGDNYELRIGGSEEDDSISSGDYFLFCDGPWVRQWWERSAKPTFTTINSNERMLSLWKLLYLEKQNVEEENTELLHYLMRSLCLTLERGVTGTHTLQSHPNKYLVMTCSKMKNYIEEHAIIGFKIEEVAQHVGLSVSRAVHLFKEVSGFTMIQYALEIKLSNALELINYSHLNLEQIAQNCGFGTYAYFHKTFKAKYRISPKQYRLRTKEEIQLFV
ncbi:AraC family transcriptional regulator [Paenibacillus abyssi]|uniref:AraC family transcriptional regulator n=1 Tax=Paenibacillus abyssi TaxID=1340531 RepID=A0A917FYK5_9BACL|nr:AraC family transcriptional regulator [Paenibacillus abyssi]GGG14269.1 AraC family transcriptional regulator [Paenibacillus abyssi]